MLPSVCRTRRCAARRDSWLQRGDVQKVQTHLIGGAFAPAHIAGRLALVTGAEDRGRLSSYEAALAIYAGVPDPHLVGQACRRLAYVAGDATERRAHVEAARAAWTSIGRADLVAALDGEFPEVPRGESIAG